MSHGNVTLFALDETRLFGERLAFNLGVPLARHEERDFTDGEHVSRPIESVRDTDAFVVQSLYADDVHSVNDKLCRLLFFISTLKDASAERVTAVLPYLCYAREDRRTRPREPVTTRYVARLFEAAGVDRIIALDVHDIAAFQNAFRIPVEHLTAIPIFVRHFATTRQSRGVTVVSPDAGGIKRAEQFRAALAQTLGTPVESAFLTKRRVDGVVAGDELLYGSVAGRAAIIFDDLIATGETIRRAIRVCRSADAAAVYAAATHGLFAGDAPAVFADASLDGLIISDTVPAFRLDSQAMKSKIAILDTTALFAEAIRRVHSGASLADLTYG